LNPSKKIVFEVYIIPKLNKRQRYIGFIIDSISKPIKLEKKDLFYEIQKLCKSKYNKDYKEMGLRLIRFDGFWGIIKCNHIEKEKTISLLNSIININSNNIQVKTLGTSGTIKTLIKKYKK